MTHDTCQRRLTLLSPDPTARAIAYSEPSCCSDGLQAGRTANDVDDRRTPVGLDFVRRTVLVEVREPVLIDDSRGRTSFFVFKLKTVPLISVACLPLIWLSL